MVLYDVTGDDVEKGLLVNEKITTVVLLNVVSLNSLAHFQLDEGALGELLREPLSRPIGIQDRLRLNQKMPHQSYRR